MTTATHSLHNQTVREIALAQPASIRVFERYGIDYCCGGRKPLAEACAERSVAVDVVLQALELATYDPSQPQHNWASTPLAELIAHIIATHHAYVTRELPRLQELADKVVARHGAAHPELLTIQQIVQALAAELTQHLSKEELVLFPYITQMEQQAGKQGLPHSCFGTVANPISMMEHEHDSAGRSLAEIRKLSHNLTPPADACPTWHAFYQAIKEFEADLHQHIHLENNILHPRAIQMESAAR